MRREIIVKDESERLDKYLANIIDLSRSQIQTQIENGFVTVNGNVEKSNFIINPKDKIEFIYEEESKIIKPHDLDIDVIYEDEDIIVVNKPKDMLVYPVKDEENTLVNGLLYKYDLLGNMYSERPGIVHRLDRDTTGLMVVARNDESYKYLVEKFSKNEVTKKYYVIAHGYIEEKVIIDNPIGRNEKNRTKMDVDTKNSKEAISIVTPLEYFKDYTLAEVEIITGRTHQIRVHLKSINHPVVGDLVYGYKNKFGIKTQLLHCYHLSFIHNAKNKTAVFETGIPEYFFDFLRKI